MSDGETPSLTLESLRIGTGNLYECINCGIPKKRDEFQGESLACLTCAPKMIAQRQGEVTEELLRKTKFDLAREELQDSHTPVIPDGVSKAHVILGGKSSSELLAEIAHEIRTGKGLDEKPSFLPRDGRLYLRTVEALQRAEVHHDNFLKSQPPAASIGYEEARAISIDTFVQEITRDKQLRKKILGILYERCSDLISELMEVANVTVVSAKQDFTTDLENGGVI